MPYVSYEGIQNQQKTSQLMAETYARQSRKHRRRRFNWEWDLEEREVRDDDGLISALKGYLNYDPPLHPRR
jgi:hypothetical protein